MDSQEVPWQDGELADFDVDMDDADESDKSDELDESDSEVDSDEDSVVTNIRNNQNQSYAPPRMLLLPWRTPTSSSAIRQRRWPTTLLALTALNRHASSKPVHAVSTPTCTQCRWASRRARSRW